MKKLLSTALAMAILSGASIANAKETKQQVPLAKEPKHNPTPQNPKGFRAPSYAIICEISYTDYSIATSVPLEITSYELWDNDGEYLIISFLTDNELIQFISSFDELCQLRLITEDYVYTGYLD